MSYEIRQSQVIHTWPAGSMIDFPELSLIMLCHDDRNSDWGSSNFDEPNCKRLIKDSRLSEAFKVDHFIIPPEEDGINNLSTFGIRFPASQYCPRCGLIHFITQKKGREVIENGTYDRKMCAFTCDDCTNNQTGIGPKLIPMRFVIATEEGFLGDFPWDWFVHKKCPNERGKGNKLFFKSEGGSASLNDIVIISEKRDKTFIAKRDLGQIFDQSIFTDSDAHGNYLDYVKGFLPKPWKGWHSNENFVSELVSDIPGKGSINDGDNLSTEARRKFPRTLQRGAGNIIFPIIYSGILLPQESYEQECPPEVQQILELAIASFKDNMPDKFSEYSNDQWREFFIEIISRNKDHKLLKIGFNQSRIIDFIKNYFGEKSEERYINKALLLRQQEFLAFTGRILEDKTVWFKKSKMSGERYNVLIGKNEFIDEIILMEKLSALKVYKGFTRVKPLMSEELVFAEAADNLNSNQLKEFERIQDARKDPVITRELPAIEVKGEGIFLKFNNKTLNKWSDIYFNERLEIINQNLLDASLRFNQSNKFISKRYLLLHTFSHIILKELAEDCGYSLSSLAEIIYCSSDDEIDSENEMNGILIFTTTSDAEGSLGGLVEKGQPEYLSSVIKKAVDKARWCSSDPLCISTDQGQGFLGLNLAACYSCVLLPETSCEKMNKYLDRATLIGTLSNPEIGFFNQ